MPRARPTWRTWSSIPLPSVSSWPTRRRRSCSPRTCCRVRVRSRCPCARVCAPPGVGPSSSSPSSSPWTTCRPPELAVLAPNIQSSFHVSTGAITFVAGIAGGFLVLGIVPMGWLADRFRRAPIIGWATFVFGLMVFASGLAINIFVFFLARFGAGISQASTQQRPRLPFGRHLPDQRARPALRSDGHGNRRGHGAQPASGRPHRHRGRRPERLALGLLHPGRPDPGGGGLRLPDP